MLTIDGLVTGIDTSNIIDGLLSIRQSQLDRLNAQKSEIVDRQSAFKGIEAQLLTLRSKMSALGRSNDNVLDARLATSSDEDALQVAASSDAIPSVVSLRVNTLAANHQIGSQVFASPDSQVTQGDLTIQVGNRTESTITIDGSNNTVQGLADAINANSEDVYASLINDASGVRILISSKHSGAANQIQITNGLGATSGESTQPDFSGTAVQEASDATITIGSGPGAIVVTSETNQFDNVIEGLTLNVTSADPDKVITVNVQNDTQGAREAIEEFVTAFNDVMEFIDSQTRYDAASESGGPLQGDRTVIGIQNDIRNTVLRTVSGVDGELNQLASIGLRFNEKGQLFIDSARLDNVLTGQVDGVDSQDVKRLFALDGQSNNSNVQFLIGSARTKTSDTPYEVDITQAAEQARIVGGQTIAANVVIDDNNNTLSLSVDGDNSGTLTLANGSYTSAELISHVQEVINGSSEFSGQSVTVGLSNDSIEITSNVYGLQSEIGSLSGTALATLGLDGTEADTGQDVVGRFLVDGEIEEAIGNGRLLSGSPDNENTADLQLRVTLTSAQVVEGAEAELTISRGFAAQLDQLISSVTNLQTGRLKTAEDGFQLQLDSMDASIERTNELFESQRETLLREFAALESAVNQLQTQSSFLASQLSSLNTFSPSQRQ